MHNGSYIVIWIHLKNWLEFLFQKEYIEWKYIKNSKFNFKSILISNIFVHNNLQQIVR